MSPAVASSTRERLGKMALLNPLPLNATHFLPHLTSKAPVTSSRRRTILQLGSQDSPLSEDELEAVYGVNAGIAASPPNFPSRHESCEILSISTGSPGPGRLARVTRKTRSIIHSSTSKSTSPNIGVKPTNVRSDASGKTVSENGVTKQSKKPARRLPIDELATAPTPTVDVPQEPISSAGVDVEDPIWNSSQMMQELPILNSDKIASPKAGLTSIRTRMKIPKFTHKSPIALRKQRRQRSTSFLKTAKLPRDLGDGFDAAERRPPQRRLPIAWTKRRTPRALPKFASLTIRAGPLPEVEWQTTSFDAGAKSVATPSRSEGSVATGHRSAGSSSDRIRRRIGFSDRVYDETVMARLSSVSAPKRAYSTSSDDESEDETEEDASETASEGRPAATSEESNWRSTPPSAQMEGICVGTSLG